MKKCIYKWAKNKNQIYHDKQNVINKCENFVLSYYLDCFGMNKKIKHKLEMNYKINNDLFFKKLSKYLNENIDDLKNEFYERIKIFSEILNDIDFDNEKNEFLFLTNHPIFKQNIGDVLMVFMICEKKYCNQIYLYEHKQIKNAKLYYIDVDGEMNIILNTDDLFNDENNYYFDRLIYCMFFDDSNILDL